MDSPQDILSSQLQESCRYDLSKFTSSVTSTIRACILEENDCGPQNGGFETVSSDSEEPSISNTFGAAPSRREIWGFGRYDPRMISFRAVDKLVTPARHDAIEEGYIARNNVYETEACELQSTIGVRVCGRLWMKTVKPDIDK